MDSTLVMNPAAGVPLSYDPFHDFATITITAKNTSLLTVRARDGPANVAELIARAKANPGKLNYGAGIVITRLAGYLFGQLAGMEMQFIPYKGSSEVVQGLLSGSVDFIIDGAAPSIPLDQGGNLSRPCKAQQPAAVAIAGRAAAGGRRRPAAARRHVELDRACRPGRHAEAQ